MMRGVILFSEDRIASTDLGVGFELGGVHALEGRESIRSAVGRHQTPLWFVWRLSCARSPDDDCADSGDP